MLSADEYRLLAEESPLMIWRCTPDGRRDYVNGAWLRYTGLERSDALAERWVAAIHPDDRGRYEDLHAGRCATATPIEIEYRLRRHDGEFRWVLDSGGPFYDDRGALAGLVGAAVDIHRRHEGDSARLEYFTVIAHELRTPLQALETYLSIVRQRHERGEQLTAKIIDRAATQLRRLTALVADLGDVSRIEQGRRLSLAPQPMDLLAIVDSVLSLQREALAPRNPRPGADHHFDLDVEGDRFPMNGDPIRLGQVVLNLLENAVKYSPDGGVVRIAMRRDGSWYRLRISDPGIGIPESDLPRIRERFFRASNVAGTMPGTGLGLAIIQEIVAGHGGRLEIVSEVGRGTTVTVVVPAA